MKLLSRFALINLFCLTTLPALAQDESAIVGSSTATAANTTSLVQYLVYLGGYLGYNITQAPPNQSSILLNLTSMQVLQTYIYSTFLGAIPVNAFSAALAQFVPNNSTMNSLANKTFSDSATNTQFNNPQSQQQGGISVITAIDQQKYQQDPVGQAVLNILGTPDASYCMDYDGTAWTGGKEIGQGCSDPGGSSGGAGALIPAIAVTANIIGPLPSTYQFYNYQYNQQFLSQLNSNTLTAPLLYGTQNASANTTSSPTVGNNPAGLTAQSQAQQAANFIRYVSGGVTPLQLPNRRTYDQMFIAASTASNKPSLQQIQAQATLSNYFTTLRTYAAQYSVGVSNLYFIMSKRLPQNPSGSTDQSQQPTSQALSEFNMATWRLFNPSMGATKQWINQINAASPATVEKEIAGLLAEINYQMYLDRQIQERILLTSSIMLMQNTRATQPNPSFAASAAQQGQ